MSREQAGKVFRRAFPDTTPVLAGYIFLGIAYGITMKENGLGPLWTGLCSLCIYGGSMQFAMVGLLRASFAPLTMLMMTVLVQARHLFYGLSMLKPYGSLDSRRFYTIFSLTDETYSLVVRGAPEGMNAGDYYLTVSLLDHCYWVTGSLLGALLGQIIPFDLTGIDFAMTALFTVIVTEQAADSVKRVRAGEVSAFEGLFPAVLGFVSTLVCLLCFGTGSFLVAAMACMLVCFGIRYGALGKEREA